MNEKLRLLARRRFLAGNRLLLTLAGTRVGLCTLSTHRQTATMSKTPITTDIHQPFDVKLNFSPQLTFDLVLIFNQLSDGASLIVSPIFGTFIGIDFQSGQDLYCTRSTNAENGSQSDFSSLLGL